MTSDWRPCTLGQVVDINPENTQGLDAGVTIRYIDLSSVSRERGIDPSLVREYVLSSAPGRARRLVRESDVLVATVRPYLRGFAQVGAEFDGQVASTGFAVLRAGPHIHPGYVWLLANSDDFMAHLMARATGSNYPAVRPDDVGSFPLLLPPLAEQRRIADLVGSVIAVREMLLELRDAVAQLLGFVRKNALGPAAATRPLGELAEVTQGRTIAKELQQSRKGAIPFFKVADVGAVGNEYELRTTSCWVDASSVVDKYRVWSVGTIVMPRVGATMRSEWRRILPQESLCDDNFLAAIPGPNLDTRYLHAVLEEVPLSARSQPGAVPSINQSHVRAIPIPMLPLEEQVRIGLLLEDVRRLWAESRDSAEQTIRVQAALSATLLSGQVSIPESYNRFLEVV